MDYFALPSNEYQRLMRWYRQHEKEGMDLFGVWTVALDRSPEILAFCRENEVGEVPWLGEFKGRYREIEAELEKPLGILLSLAKPRDDTHAGMIRKRLLDDHVAVADLLRLPPKAYANLDALAAGLGETGKRLQKTLDKVEDEYYGY